MSQSSCTGILFYAKNLVEKNFGCLREFIFLQRNQILQWPSFGIQALVRLISGSLLCHGFLTNI